MRDIKSRTMQFDHKRYSKNLLDTARKPRSINFEAYAAEGNRFINDVAFQLRVNRNSAARITRAVLHAVRDRLPPIDAVQFAQGLPMALKAIFIDQYEISKVPVKIRSSQKFLDYIYSKGGMTAETDFPDMESVVEALQAVFFVLERHMSFGQVQQIKMIMGAGVQELLESENTY